MEVFQETAIYITDCRWFIKLEFQSVLLDSHLHIFCNEHDHVCCSVSDQAEESPPEETLASFPLSKSLSGSHDEDALFKERLRNMGKSIYFDTPKKDYRLYNVITPNVAVEWIASLFHIWEVLVQIMAWTLITLTDMFCFPPSLHSDAGIAPQIRPQPLPF